LNTRDIILNICVHIKPHSIPYCLDGGIGSGMVNSGFISDNPNSNHTLMLQHENTDEDGIPTEV